MKKVAITGGLASGKTSVCRILQSLGAYVISADEIVHQLLSPHTELGKRVVGIFGHDIIQDASFDRNKLAENAFKEPDKLKQLEELLHPAVFQEIEHRYQALVNNPNPPPLFVAEIPLLFETSAQSKFDQVVVIDAPLSLCQKRFVASSPHNIAEQFALRMKRQMSMEEKKRKADFVIENNGSKENLKKMVQSLYQTLISN